LDDPIVFVGNIEFEATTEDLRDFFRIKLDNESAIKNCRVIERKNRQGRKVQKFAFVSFFREDVRDQALELNHADLNGRPLRICLPSQR
jgi:RNA recognition motif-containing protein